MKNKFYAVQLNVDGFGHDTSTVICYPTKKACKNWIKRNAKDWSERLGGELDFKIVEQEFGTSFEEYWG